MNLSRYLDPLLVERLNHLQLPSRRLAEGGAVGLHKSPLRGASVEFRQHRFYVPGDDPRKLDWRVLARTDRHFVKQFDQETNLRCLIALDCSGSMAYGAGIRKFDYAARLAAAVGYLLLGNDEQVGLATISNKIEQWISPTASTRQLSRMVDAMERAEPRGKSEARGLQKIANRLPRRSLVIAISDFFWPAEGIGKALAHLHHNRHETILLRVLHRDEIEFPFKSPVRLDGLEGEAGRACDPAMMRRIYLENFARHEKAMRDSCRINRAEMNRFVTDEPIAEALAGFLRRRLASGSR
jgi:uncharacterized protein (DUF58 family)